MLELLAVFGFVAFVAVIVFKSFKNPRGVYLRSGIAALLVPLVAMAIWQLAGSQIASEAGFGALVLVVAATGLGAAAALAAIVAATIRHVVDAVRS